MNYGAHVKFVNKWLEKLEEENKAPAADAPAEDAPAAAEAPAQPASEEPATQA